MSQAIYIMIIYSIVVTVIVTIFVAERVDREPKATKLKDIWSATKDICKKRATKIWLLLTIFKSFGIDLCVQI